MKTCSKCGVPMGMTCVIEPNQPPPMCLKCKPLPIPLEAMRWSRGYQDGKEGRNPMESGDDYLHGYNEGRMQKLEAVAREHYLKKEDE